MYAGPVAGDPDGGAGAEAAGALTRRPTAGADPGAPGRQRGPVRRAFHARHGPVLGTEPARPRTLRSHITTVHSYFHQ